VGIWFLDVSSFSDGNLKNLLYLTMYSQESSLTSSNASQILQRKPTTLTQSTSFCVPWSVLVSVSIFFVTPSVTCLVTPQTPIPSTYFSL
jgi:hypothetical protein